MSGANPGFSVFISYSATDTWVVRQIARHIEEMPGATTFLFEVDIEHGDDFEDKILAALRSSQELLVLLTPKSIIRPYIWMEIGAFWERGKRIVAVLYGLSPSELVAQEGMPALLKRINLLEINRIDTYFEQLKRRVEREKRKND